MQILKRLKGSGWQMETGAKPGTRDWRGCSSLYTNEDSRKYRACQLLYWYRSNELWKNHRNSHAARHVIIPSVVGVSGADVVVSPAHADVTCQGVPACVGKDFLTGSGFITGTPSGSKGNF